VEPRAGRSDGGMGLHGRAFARFDVERDHRSHHGLGVDDHTPPTSLHPEDVERRLDRVGVSLARVGGTEIPLMWALWAESTSLRSNGMTC